MYPKQVVTVPPSRGHKSSEIFLSNYLLMVLIVGGWPVNQTLGFGTCAKLTLMAGNFP
jgi:hypothetical protein